MFSRILILLLLTSCSLFKGPEKLKGDDLLKHLQAIKLEGEGKGRLHIRERQYLFGIEALLKDEKDWLMAVTIPLNGEEVLSFPALREEKVASDLTDTFALRIDAGIRENLKGSTLRGEEFLSAMRKTLRFLLAHRLKLPVQCVAFDSEKICSVGEQDFPVTENEKSITITTAFAGHELITTASNLTGPFFTHTQFRVKSPEGKQDLLTLELFWQ